MGDAYHLDEFAPVDHEAWQAKVNKALGPALRKLYRTVDGDLEVPLLFDTQASGHACARATREPWGLAQEYADCDPEAVASAITCDRKGGLESTWLRMHDRLRSGGSATPASSAGSGAVVTTATHVHAISEACSGGALWIDAGAGSTAVLKAIGPEALVGLHGGLLCDPIGALAQYGHLGVSAEAAMTELVASFAQMRDQAPDLAVVLASGVPYQNAGASASLELGVTIATAITYLRALVEAGHPAGEVLARTRLRLGAVSDVFVGMAKFRAARVLWQQVAREFDASTGPVQIAARSCWRTRTQRDPWVNLLRATTEVFAASCGGADEIAIQPFSEALGSPTEAARRWALGIAHVLREESHLCRVADPSAGSGYAESLTESLAERAWSVVQQIEQAGGMIPALQTGWVQQRVRAQAQIQDEHVARGRHTVTGVSLYPALDEPKVSTATVSSQVLAGLPQTLPAAVQVAPLVAQRLAQPFERLRDASDAHLCTQGSRPEAWLVTLGPSAEHRGRLDGVRSMVAVGGFVAREVAASAIADTATGPQLAVLVGSDERLAAEACELSKRLREVGTAQVVLAAPPGKLPAATQQGTDGFLYPGADVLAVMTKLHAAMSIGATQGVRQ